MQNQTKTGNRRLRFIAKESATDDDSGHLRTVWLVAAQNYNLGSPVCACVHETQSVNFKKNEVGGREFLAS